jgi:hypothetical protein
MTLKTISTTDLQAELARREQHGRHLHERRERLARELEAIDAELTSLGAAPRSAPAGRRRREATQGSGEGGQGGQGGDAQPREGREPRQRAKNALSLGDALAQAMEVRAVVTPAEASELVRRNGYTSTSANFGMLVSNALAKDPRFKRLSRGQYERVA